MRLRLRSFAVSLSLLASELFDSSSLFQGENSKKLINGLSESCRDIESVKFVYSSCETTVASDKEKRLARHTSASHLSNLLHLTSSACW